MRQHPRFGPVRSSQGTGAFRRSQLARIGKNVIFEKGVLVFHPENISVGDNVYVGHNTILKAYYRNKFEIGSGTWIGQQCLFHTPGGLEIGENVGIGPGVNIITSTHRLDEPHKPILHSKIDFKPVRIGNWCDIGAGAIIMPGVTIGKGVQIGAGAVVTKNIPDYYVAAGVPAKLIRKRR